MIRINKAGTLYIVLTVLIGFSAVNTGNNLVYLIASALLSYMTVSGFFGKNNLRALDVQLALPAEVFAGTETPVGVRLECRRRWFPAFLVTVELSGTSVMFPYVRPRSAEIKHVPVAFGRRGVCTLSGIRVSSTFPFDFFTRSRTLEHRFEVLVFPKPRRCSPWVLSGDPRIRSGDALTERAGYDSDILSIRDYVPGDPMKYISWKSTAKTGSLQTRELAAMEERPVVLHMDRLTTEDVEGALSCAVYWVLRLSRSGVPVGLILGGEFLSPGLSRAHRLSMLRRLALYDPNR